MIRLEQIPDGFELYFHNYLFLRHTKTQPCLYMGIGEGRFKSRYGSFHIKDKIKSKIPLIEFTLISQTEDKIEIQFENQSEKLNLVIAQDSHLLVIIPTSSNSSINRFWFSLKASAKECVYGAGEQFSELNLQGRKLPIWVEENGLCRGDPKWLTFLLNLLVGIGGHWYTTYYPQPTFVSSENYFCHLQTFFYAELDFRKADQHLLYVWELPERIIIGKYNSALETISGLSEMLGHQPELPEWVYDGVWLGIQGGPKMIEQKLKQCLDKGVLISAVWCQDWTGIRMRRFGKRLFWNWKFDETLYPNLPMYIKNLNQRSIRFLGYINPFLAVEDKAELYKEASDKGYCVKNGQGQDYLLKIGNGTTALLDLSNPDAVSWIKTIIKTNLIGIGLSGWMADFGEYLPTDAILFSGENAEEFHNKYPVIWAQTVREAVEEAGQLGEIVFFTRSGYSHASKYTTLVWAGDQLVNWSIDGGFASVIPAGISLGISGIGYYHSDIGGYSTFWKYKRTPEVFMRWAEHAAFTMVMRTHEGNMPNKNIQFNEDEILLDHFARMSKIHVHLKPYLLHLSKEYQEDGIPPMRALYMHYEEDPVVHSLKYQYLLGNDLLVAPVIKPKMKRWKVYLPDETWIHVWSGKEYSKGWYEIDAPLGRPPVFYLKNSEYSELFKQMKNRLEGN